MKSKKLFPTVHSQRLVQNNGKGTQKKSQSDIALSETICRCAAYYKCAHLQKAMHKDLYSVQNLALLSM